MWVNSQSCIFLVTRIVSILALSVGSSSAFAFDGNGRRLLGTESRGGQFRLMHYTHPESPQYVPGLSLSEKVKYGVLSSRERVAVLSSRMSEAGVAFETKPGSGSGDLSSNSLPSFNSSVHIIPGLLEYSMEISIGTPPQKLSLLADTGSDLVWAQCLPCPNCSAPKLAPSFDPANSSTYTRMSCSDPLCAPAIKNACNPTCQFKYRYGNPHALHPSGIMGDLSYESITLDEVGTGTTTTVNGFAFGCGYPNLNATFREPPPIAGLGMGNLSFVSQLGSLYGNKFSYCLVSPYGNSNATSPLLFGDAAVPKVVTQYTPILHNPYTSSRHYFIGLKGIEVDGVSLDIPCGTFDFNASTRPGGVISDSGTSFTLLVTPAYTRLLEKMQSLIKYPALVNGSTAGETLNLCYNLTNVPSPKFPTVTMVFEGMNLDLPQDNVFVMTDDEMTTCLAFHESFGNFSIWGNTQQQNFQVLHDLEAMQFGYAKVQCDQFNG